MPSFMLKGNISSLSQFKSKNLEKIIEFSTINHTKIDFRKMFFLFSSAVVVVSQFGSHLLPSSTKIIAMCSYAKVAEFGTLEAALSTHSVRRVS